MEGAIEGATDGELEGKVGELEGTWVSWVGANVGWGVSADTPPPNTSQTDRIHIRYILVVFFSCTQIKRGTLRED